MFSQEIGLPKEEKNKEEKNLPEIWFLPILASLSSLALLNNFFKIQLWALLSVWICLRILNFKQQSVKGFAKAIVFFTGSFVMLLIISFGYNLAIVNSEIPDDKNLIIIAGALALYFFSARLRNPHHINNLIRGCIFAFYVQLLLGLIEAVTGFRFDPDTEAYRTLQSRSISEGYAATLGNPNDFVYFILIGLALSIELIFNHSRIRVRTVFFQIGLASLVFFFILANNSRFGLICFAVVAIRFFYLLVNNENRPLVLFMFKSVSLAIVILVIVTAFAYIRSISSRETNSFLNLLGFSYGDYTRGFWLVDSLTLLNSIPFFGLGPGASYTFLKNSGVTGSDLHFSTLLLAYDFGVIIALLFLSILTLLCLVSLLPDKINTSISNKAFVTPLLSMTIILFFWTIGGSGAIYQPTFWVLLATGSVIAVQKTIRHLF